MYRQHLFPCDRCAQMRCPCRPEPTALEVELLSARGNRPEKLPKPYRSARRLALDANQPGTPSQNAAESRTGGERPDVGLTALELLGTRSARKWTYRPESAA